MNWVGVAVALKTVPLRKLVEDAAGMLVGETVTTEYRTVGLHVLIVMIEREGELANAPPAAEVETDELLVKRGVVETTATGAEVLTSGVVIGVAE